MSNVLEENKRLRGQLAWTERERDSLRVSIHNLRDYVAELNAELYARSDENRVDCDTKRDTTQTTLTDAEREAVETADAYMSAAGCHNTNVQKTLRGLLERLS